MHKFRQSEVGPSLRDGGGGGAGEEQSSFPNVNVNTTTNAEQALRARGVVAAAQVAKSATPDLIGAWCEYAERHADMSAGALVTAIRSGSPPPRPPRRPASREADYAEQITAWLRRHLPDLDRPRLGPHPIAVAEVIRLHHRHGKHAITVTAHGAQIRRAVADFEREMSA